MDQLPSLSDIDVLYLHLMATIISYLIAQRNGDAAEMAKHAEKAIDLVIELNSRLIQGGHMPSHWRAAR